jgi:hypothetical protein
LSFNKGFVSIPIFNEALNESSSGLFIVFLIVTLSKQQRLQLRSTL